MAFNLASITNEQRMRAPRIVLVGVPKIGKSEWAAGSNRPVFIPIKREEGIDDLNVNRYPVCNTFDDVMSCLYSLASEEHNHVTVVIDSLSTLEPLNWEKVCLKHHVDSIEKVMGGFGKGYGEAIKEWMLLADTLDWLRENKNMSSILIGHATVKRFDDPSGPSYDQYQIDLQDAKNTSAANFFYRWADVVLFANTKVAVKSEDVGFKKEKHRGIDISGGQRFLFTQKNPAYPAGGRGIYGRLPAELPLNYNAFMEAAIAASKQQ